MRKPTAQVFFTLYFLAWLLMQVSVAYSGGTLMSFSGVNMLFVLVNLIGVVFAMNGWAPWRDEDRPVTATQPKHDWLAKSYPQNPFPLAFGLAMFFAGLFAIIAYMSWSQ